MLSLSVAAVMIFALLSIGGPTLNKMKDVKANNDLNSVAQACQQYYLSLGHWPSMVSDLQPYFLSVGFNGNSYVFNLQSNIFTIVSGQNSITVVRPRGLLGRLDYNSK